MADTALNGLTAKTAPVSTDIFYGVSSPFGAGDDFKVTGANLSKAMGLGTADSPQFAGVNVGHATDTTLTRVSAGVLAVEGNTIYAAGGTDVAFVDGGTGISSWTQYLIPYAATTTSIGQIAIGTSGQVLTSNGAGAAPTFQAASAGTPTMKLSTIFESTGRMINTVTGSGANTVGAHGLYQETGAATVASAKATWKFHYASSNSEAGSPVFSIAVTCGSGAFGSDFDTFWGLGDVTVAAANITYTVKHIGFKALRVASGTVSLYATQADGTTENASSALTTLTAGDYLDLIVKVNSTTSADYYWRKNGGALSSATNLTSNLPSGAVDFGVSAFTNKNVATYQDFMITGASYER